MSSAQSVRSSLRLWGASLGGLAVTFLLAVAAWWVSRQVGAVKLPFGIPGKALEYPLWAALLGVLGNVLLRALKMREYLQPGVHTELYLKIGLVLLGAGVDLTLIVSAARGAILQSLVMISGVFFFCWWLAGRFGLDEKLRAVMASAVSICGVSAAIAAAGSVLARKEQVTYITALVILVALPLMVLSPLLASALGLSQTVAGAWFGGNIDTTAAVVGAGTLYGEQAQKIATIVKSTQNTLIGLVAFLLALYFASREAGAGTRPGVRVIWDRFPKFVLGFLLASVLYSMGVIDGGKGTTIEALKNWAFTLAFVSMGLELSFSEFRSMGWRPVMVFLLVTLFNTFLALGVAWVVFTWLFPVG
ncbi:MAG TPA: putative sulfate exporter family transporter [Anaerolinea thermolimosa]|uniref:Putative sulfate exporter family transporter n=1 Tax=Anaerolinea thermolimosa TaxID=229919 RepID=A0A3D1JG41_9CHLR|nr:putative sulfate exporter family transporter [Anaerolinea thermolimosa]GAP07941.1 predicted membrane protein [Anaerolinea thermolimosa]HCE17492.1 putative sulfate exporter family transporter [Anaerolinea thermolimosa]